MESVLIVSNTSTTMGIISDLIVSQTFSRIVTAQSGSEARRNILENEFDLIIVDTPVKDEFGDGFATDASENSSSGVILIVDYDKLNDMNMVVEDYGIFVVPRSVTPDFFYQAVKLLLASRKKNQKLMEENKKLMNKMEETRMVGRAKCVLIERLKMTETQAHRYIEKQSMNLRQNRMSVAENILKTYEI